MEQRTTACQCNCGAQQFKVRLEPDEQVGLLTCSAGHHSLLLDSRDYWADVLQEGRPKEIKCRCGGVLFRVNLVYDFREDGDVRSVDVLPRCCDCGRGRAAVSFEIDYSPTAELISKPLDPIEQPWLKARRTKLPPIGSPLMPNDSLHTCQGLGGFGFTAIPTALKSAESRLSSSILN